MPRRLLWEAPALRLVAGKRDVDRPPRRKNRNRANLPAGGGSAAAASVVSGGAGGWVAVRCGGMHNGVKEMPQEGPVSAHVFGACVRVVEDDVLVLLALAAAVRCCPSFAGIGLRTIAAAAAAIPAAGCRDGTGDPCIQRRGVDVVQYGGPQGAQAGQDLARLRVLSEEVVRPVEGGGHDFVRPVSVSFSSSLLPRWWRWWR